MGIHTIAFEAKQLCRTHHSGVLSTHSIAMPGYPFGSVVPYFLTHQGDAILYISDLAQHTRNIKANGKVSLTIFDAAQDDSQANGRVTLLGECSLYDEDEKVKQQYFDLFPQSKDYQQTHDFHFYRIRCERVRFIGGFGKIHWINKDLWNVPEQEWHQQTAGMIAHMNQDHQDAMRAILAANHQLKTPHVTMLSVFAEGAHYQTDKGQICYIPFVHLCNTPTEVRQALVAQTQEARRFLENSTQVS